MALLEFMTPTLSTWQILMKKKASRAVDAFAEEIVRAEQLAIPYLVMHPVFSNPGDDEGRQYALDLKDMLGDYNEQGCPEEDEDEDEDMDADKSMSSAVDHTDWGTLKSLYR